jgi:hypothetical protein
MTSAECPDSHFKQPPSSSRRNRARVLAIPREGMERREALYSFRAVPGAMHGLRRRQVYAVCANVYEPCSPPGAPSRRFSGSAVASPPAPGRACVRKARTLRRPASSSRTGRSTRRAGSRGAPGARDTFSRARRRRIPLRQPNVSGRRPQRARCGQHKRASAGGEKGSRGCDYYPSSPVMAGLVPAIHALSQRHDRKAWMPGTGPGMTKNRHDAIRAGPPPTRGRSTTVVVTRVRTRSAC